MDDGLQLPQRLAAHQGQFRQALGIALQQEQHVAQLVGVCARSNQGFVQGPQALVDERAGRRQLAHKGARS